MIPGLLARAALLAIAGGNSLIGPRLTRLEQLQREAHAMMSARITLTWTATLPVTADVKAVFLPNSSYGCSLLDCSIQTVAPVNIPQILTRFRLEEPLPFSSRATMFGSNLIRQSDLIPPNPIVGVIVFPTSLQQNDPSIFQVVNVIQQLMTPGTQTIFEIHCNLRRGDLVAGR